MKFVEQFNDWSVRQYDGAEFWLDGKFYHGMITKLSEEGIEFRPFSIDFESRPISEKSYDKVFIKIEDFDKVKLEIWDEHRGGDNSSIGCSGYFTEWRYVWPEENTPYKLTRTYLKSLEPKQLALDF